MSEKIVDGVILRPCPDCADLSERGLRAQCETCGGHEYVMIEAFGDTGLPIYQTIVGKLIEQQLHELLSKQKNLPDGFSSMVDEKFWELTER